MEIRKLKRQHKIILLILVAISIAALYWVIDSTRLRPIGMATIQGNEIYLGEGLDDAVKRLGLKQFGMPYSRAYCREYIIDDSTTEYVDMTFSLLLSRVTRLTFIETSWTSKAVDEVLDSVKSRLIQMTKGSACSQISVSHVGKSADVRMTCTRDNYEVSYLIVVESGNVNPKNPSQSIHVEFMTSCWSI